MFRLSIANPTEYTSSAILVFAHLLIINSFAFGNVDEQLLVARDQPATSAEIEVMAPWLFFIRNGCVMLCDFWDHLSESPVRALVDLWETPIEGVSEVNSVTWINFFLAIVQTKAEESDGSQITFQYFADESWPDDVRKTYVDAATPLGTAFAKSEALGLCFTIFDFRSYLGNGGVSGGDRAGSNTSLRWRDSFGVV
jgi:hypothetical protein